MVTMNNYKYLVGVGNKTDFLVKHSSKPRNSKGQIKLGMVHVNKELIGKKVSFKVEIIEYEAENE